MFTIGNQPFDTISDSITYGCKQSFQNFLQEDESEGANSDLSMHLLVSDISAVGMLPTFCQLLLMQACSMKESIECRDGKRIHFD